MLFIVLLILVCQIGILFLGTDTYHEMRKKHGHRQGSLDSGAFSLSTKRDKNSEPFESKYETYSSLPKIPPDQVPSQTNQLVDPSLLKHNQDQLPRGNTHLAYSSAPERNRTQVPRENTYLAYSSAPEHNRNQVPSENTHWVYSSALTAPEFNQDQVPSENTHLAYSSVHEHNLDQVPSDDQGQNDPSTMNTVLDQKTIITDNHFSQVVLFYWCQWNINQPAHLQCNIFKSVDRHAVWLYTRQPLDPHKGIQIYIHEGKDIRVAIRYTKDFQALATYIQDKIAIILIPSMPNVQLVENLSEISDQTNDIEVNCNDYMLQYEVKLAQGGQPPIPMYPYKPLAHSEDNYSNIILASWCKWREEHNLKYRLYAYVENETNTINYGIKQLNQPFFQIIISINPTNQHLMVFYTKDHQDLANHMYINLKTAFDWIFWEKREQPEMPINTDQLNFFIQMKCKRR